jgi:ABC-type multidrug transport system ATPase subunit
MLTIKGLSKTYGNGIQALKNVSLEIPTGMFGLLGPNGAGKTTLMRTIATLQEPDDGTIRMGSLDVLRDKDEVRKILGYLPQEFGVYPRFSAEAMLLHFAVLKGITGRTGRKGHVRRILEITNLWGVRKQKLGTFSGGMRQRFGVAQALLGDPKLIILDEPTAGLDPEERLRFLNLLSQIGESVVIILSTHIVEDVRDLCRQVAIIGAGRVLLRGDPRELAAELEGKIWEKSVSDDEVEASRMSMALISTRLLAGRRIIRVLSEGTPGDGFEPATPGLEDVYFAALGRAQLPADSPCGMAFHTSVDL